MSLLGKQSGPKLFVRLSKVSALEDVRLRQVLLYVNNGLRRAIMCDYHPAPSNV